MSLRQWIQKLGLVAKSRKKSKPFTFSIAAHTIEIKRETDPDSASTPMQLPPLTPREHEIVQLLRQGYSNKEIARELDLSVGTVKWNMTNILGKFGLENGKQLIAFLA